MSIEIYETLVVSLPSDTDRRDHIKQHIPTLGLGNFSFVDAFGPKSRQVRVAYRDNIVKRWPNCFRCNKPSCECNNNILIPQQVANWFSFLKAFEKCAQKPDEYFLICEDDVAFHKGARGILERFFKSFEPKSDKILIRMCQSGQEPHQTLTSSEFDLTNRICMSNAAFILNGKMAQFLLDKFEKIHTTSDIWIHKEIAANPELHAATIEPLLATDLSYNKDHAEFTSRIHPKGINDEDRDRKLSHVKRVDNVEVYNKLLEEWKSGSAISVQPEEEAIISKCISDGDVVFDIGAYHGEWSYNVLSQKNCRLHAFEASSEAFAVLQEDKHIFKALNPVAVSLETGSLTFHTYHDKPRLSSIYRRRSVEKTLMPKGFKANEIPCISLDDYWPAENGLVNFIKLDVEGAEFDVLRGANDLLKRGCVDYIQFEYGGTFLDAGTSLKLLYFYLRRHRYHLFRVKGEEFTEIVEFDDDLEDFRYTNFLAVNERHLSRFLGRKPNIRVYFEDLDELNIQITGIVHIGAHEGHEAVTYRDRKINPIIMVEANPQYAKSLKERYKEASDITVFEGAISDRAGTVEFNIASSDQSSSLLPLKKHSELYPKIVYTDKIQVEAFTLDECLEVFGAKNPDLPPVNMIVMDIQGAELMALRGGTASLSHIDAIQLEVNYAELYEGCPLIWELDAFLSKHDFIRYRTDTPFSRDWGDALYVRRPVVANSTIGSLGRFGNQIFQYGFLRCHANDMGFHFENSPWIGDQMFNVSAGTTHAGKGLRRIEQKTFTTQRCEVLNSSDRLANANIKGFFQYDTIFYRKHRELLLSDFSFKGAYAKRADHIAAKFWNCGTLVVGIHLRRGDYGNRFFFISPTSWYLDWLRELRQNHPKLTVYIASDEFETVAPDFAEFDIISAADFERDSCLGPEFFDDFAALTLCDKVAISNSSFSFAASMLNRRADSFMRPDLSERKLIPYDPWSAPPLLRSELAEDHGPEFMK